MLIGLTACCNNDKSTKKANQNLKSEHINSDNNNKKAENVDSNVTSENNQDSNNSNQPKDSNNQAQNYVQPKDGTPGPQGSNSVYENGHLVNGSPNNVPTNQNDSSNSDSTSKVNESNLNIPYGQPGHIPTTRDPDYKGILTTP